MLEETKETGPAEVSTSEPMHVEGTSVGTASKDVFVIDDPGLAIPVTPPRDSSPDASPRASSSVRPSGEESEEVLKRQKTEDLKRQRINQLKAEYEERLTKVKLAYKEYFTVDDYSTDLNVEEVQEDDIWAGEDSVKLSAVPDALWSDAAVEKPPTEAPERWIDDIADRLEIQRLTQMQVLVPAAEFEGAITGKLTTRFVRDWRLKDFGEGPSMRKRWMRRSRLVAREFNNSKRLDTFSPATGAHTNNLLPIKYLWMRSQALEMPAKEEYSVVMASCDVKDAFLQVCQEDPILVTLQGEQFVINRNLPGQRLGAKQWFLFLKDFLQSSMGFEFCAEQPCLARTEQATILIHVDDILYIGKRDFWRDVFLKKMGEKFSISHDELTGTGSSIKFLRRTITEVEDGIVFSPGTNVSKVVQAFEEAFGAARAQKIPCDSSIQLPDTSQKLDQRDSSSYRSIVGLCLYIGRERPDLMCAIKELSAAMSSPTLSSLQHLRKLVGYMKHVGDVGIHVGFPAAGQGTMSAGGDHTWVLETFSDADWSANKTNRRSTSCSVHMLNNNMVFASSRSQKVVSLSSCESELHSMVSAACDGIFIRSCTEFVLGEEIQHLLYTDSSSARQLASRQGCGRARHVPGKILWLQEKTQDKSIMLRQVQTVWNLADIGTKCLSKQRLYLLMHEAGLVFIPSFERVGGEEHDRQSEKSAQTSQLRKVAKAILRMSLAMGLGPVEAGGTSMQCPSQESATTESFWNFNMMVVFMLVLATMAVVMYRMWKRLENLIAKLREQGRGLDSAEFQLAEHYEYAASLDERITALVTTTDETATHLSLMESELHDEVNTLDTNLQCLRYGLMEFGGFVRNDQLSSEQRQHMFVQERANYVLWQMRCRAETTDPAQTEHAENDGEGGEEESLSDDEPVTTRDSPGSFTTLLENLRLDQSVAVSNGWHNDASNIQQAMMILLESSADANAGGLEMETLNRIRNIFQRFFRFHRNRGSDERSQRYRLYVENIAGLM